jgi:hypothetical protein
MKSNSIVIPRFRFLLSVILIYIQVYFFISIYTLLPAMFLLFGIVETAKKPEKYE